MSGIYTGFKLSLNSPNIKPNIFKYFTFDFFGSHFKPYFSINFKILNTKGHLRRCFYWFFIVKPLPQRVIY